MLFPLLGLLPCSHIAPRRKRQARNRLTPSGACAIAHALHNAASLRVLWLSGNRLGEEGGAALCEALPSAGWMEKGCMLEELWLASAMLGDRTATGACVRGTD